MTHIEFVTPMRNFMLYLTEDGTYAVNTDLIAEGRAEGRGFRVVAAGGTVRLRRLKRGRARAMTIRPYIEALPFSRRTRDDLYVAALKVDGARGLWATKAWLSFRGLLLNPWRYWWPLHKI